MHRVLLCLLIAAVGCGADEKPPFFIDEDPSDAGDEASDEGQSREDAASGDGDGEPVSGAHLIEGNNSSRVRDWLDSSELMWIRSDNNCNERENPIPAIDEAEVYVDHDDVAESGTFDAHGEPFSVDLRMPDVSSQLEGEGPFDCGFRVWRVCDGATADDPSDDLEQWQGGGDGVSTFDLANNIQIVDVRVPETCRNRRALQDEVVTIDWLMWCTGKNQAGEDKVCVREFLLELSAEGGVRAGESDPEALGYPELTDCEGGKLDPETSLCWQEPTAYDTTRPGNFGDPGETWADATTYCENLERGGHAWRLPTIDELRTLLRAPYTYNGCSINVLGGTVRVSDPDCLEASCLNQDRGCNPFWGPGGNGCYWPLEMIGGCERYRYWWSSSPVPDIADHFWRLGFQFGDISHASSDDLNQYTRCVRTVE